MVADGPGAHRHLASIEPFAAGPGLLEQVLDALLLAAGASRGAAIDPAGRLRPASRGLTLSGPAVAQATALLRRARMPQPEVRARVAEALLGEGTERASVIPLTAGEELLAVVLLPEPLVDPAAFASVTSHAASILAWVRMSEKVREADFELRYRVWELESLYDVGLSIAGTLDLESLADDILLKSISLLNARTGTLLVRQDAEDASLLVKSFGPPLVSELLPPEALGTPLICNQRSARPESLAQAPAEKLLAVPIVSDGSPLGLLVVADKENRAGGIDDFGPSDARILSLFANQAAIALENARLHREAVEKEKMEREVEIAASIQRTILPASLPPLEGLRIAAGNRPTRQVGGDFFDVHPLPDGRVAFCVADVSGKGIPAALLVSTVHACIHLLIEAGASDLPRLVRRINTHLTQFSAARKFVTLFLAVYDPPSRSVRYVNAGHNPAIWLAGSEVHLLPSTGLPIGMFPTATYDEAVATLGADDVLLLYSDGITEAIDAREEEFGMDRLTAVLRGCRSEEPTEMKDRIFLSVAEFTRGVAQYDDQTVLVARPV